MARQYIDTSLPNSGQGDRLRDAFNKVEANFGELYQLNDLVTALQGALNGKQPLDVDLSAIAALTTTAFGRYFLTQADGPAARALLSLGTAALLAAGVAGGAATLDPSTGKLVSSQVPDALLGAVRYQGGWNAATNTPLLPTPAASNKGWYYIVLTAGTTSLPGVNGIPISDWQVGDWAVSDGTYWEKVDSSDQVISVAGLQGVVTATALTGALNAFVGDSGSGGTKGLVPAAAPGDAAAGKFLSANGGFSVPATSGGGISAADATRIARRAALVFG